MDEENYTFKQTGLIFSLGCLEIYRVVTDKRSQTDGQDSINKCAMGLKVNS
jgi:hypothetical protein